MAHLDYITQTDKDISVTFADRPQDPALLFYIHAPAAATGAAKPTK